MKRYVIFVAIVVVLCLSALLTACSPTPLATPTGLTYSDGILSWDEVPHADGYRVEIDGQTVAEVSTNSYVYTARAQTAFRVAAVANGKRYQTSLFCDVLNYKPYVDTRTALTVPTIIEVNGSGVLSWTYVVNATGYRIYLNGNSVATVGVQTTYALTVPDEGAYTVQVQAIGEGAYRDSARSAIYRVEAQNGKIKAPALRAPAATYNTTEYRVEWAAISNAVAYEVYQNGTMVQRISADDNTAKTTQGTIVTYFYSPYVNVRHTRLYVVAVGDGVNYVNSAPGSEIAFPLLNDGAPTGLGFVVEDNAVVLAWDKLPNCSAYRIKVETDDSLYGVFGATTNRLQLVLPDGAYRVSVAGDGDGYIFSPTEYSAQIEMKFAGGSPLPIRLNAPQNVYFYEKNLSFDAVQWASGYQIWVDTPYDDTQGEYRYDVAALQWELPAFLYETIVTVYVRAVGEGAYCNSLWSQGVCYYPVDDRLDMEDLLPDAERHAYSVQLVPAGLRYADGFIVWDGVEGVDYELVIDGAKTVQAAATYALDMTTAHVVKVRALSHTDYVLDSPYSAEMYVERARLPVPTGLSVQGSTLGWNAIADVDHYIVQIDGENYLFATNSVDLQTILPYDGSYDVRVAAVSGRAYLADSLFSRSITFVADYEQRGTEHKPYEIATVEDLALLQRYPTAFFRLIADVEVGEIAPMFDAQSAFAGSIDGDGHALTDIKLVAAGAANGLFGCLYGATIRRLRLQFASVAFDTRFVAGVLAGQAVMSTFEDITLSATASYTGSFGTVGNSEACLYTGCVFAVRYTSLDATATLGGIVANSKRDSFETSVVLGSLAGGIYMGAVAGVSTDSAVNATVGRSDSAFVYTATNAYVGAVGKGNLSQCTLNVWAQYQLEGNCYAGAFGGQLTVNSVSGAVDALYTANAGTLYLGGIIGQGSVDIVDVAVTLRLAGSAVTLYAGGAVGYQQGMCVCRDTCVFALDVDFVADGRYLGGVVGFGNATFAGSAQGTVRISANVSVGRLVGTTPTPADVDWVVEEKE